jgi:hypothetical protein
MLVGDGGANGRHSRPGAGGTAPDAGLLVCRHGGCKCVGIVEIAEDLADFVLQGFHIGVCLQVSSS